MSFPNNLKEIITRTGLSPLEKTAMLTEQVETNETDRDDYISWVNDHPDTTPPAIITYLYNQAVNSRYFIPVYDHMLKAVTYFFTKTPECEFITAVDFEHLLQKQPKNASYYYGMGFVPEDLVKNAPLEEANLSNCDWEAIPPLYLRFTAISELDLSFNRITTINTAAYSCLEVLNLTKNCLTEFPNIHSTTLTSLNLSRNTITSIPDSVKLPDSLKVLNLSGNENLKNLPLDFFSTTTSLVDIRLCNNKITALPSLETCQLLEILDINETLISTLPPEFTVWKLGDNFCPNLKSLHLNSIKFTEEPTWLLRFPLLEDLSLCCIEYGQIPTVIEKLIYLERLYLNLKGVTALFNLILPSLKRIALKVDPTFIIPLEISESTILESVNITGLVAPASIQSQCVFNVKRNRTLAQMTQT